MWSAMAMDGAVNVPLVNMSLLELLSWTSLISTVTVYLCGIPICRRIAAKGNTDRTPAAPFLAGLISSSFWTRYGLIRGDRTVVWVSSIGLVMQCSYLTFYWSYTRHKQYLHRQLGVIGLIVLSMLYYVHTFIAAYPEQVLSNVGLVCVVLNIATLAAPLAGLRDVLRTKTTETIPFAMSLGNLVVSSQWYVYALLVRDPYIMWPNVTGIALGCVQLSLFVIYPSRKHGTLLKM